METKEKEQEYLEFVVCDGTACIWESGEGDKTGGYSVIVADYLGKPKRAFEIRTWGEEHACVPIEVGDHVIDITHHEGDFEIDVWRIIELDFDNKVAPAYLVARFRKGKWTEKLPSYLRRAVRAGKLKAQCSKCSEPHYVVGHVKV